MSKITLVTFPGFYFRVFVSNMLVDYFEPLEQKKRKIRLVYAFSYPDSANIFFNSMLKRAHYLVKKPAINSCYVGRDQRKDEIH